jgi:hypothetical protein
VLLRDAKSLIIRGRLLSYAVSTEAIILRMIKKDSCQIRHVKDVERHDGDSNRTRN